jgi:hypothetical protein
MRKLAIVVTVSCVALWSQTAPPANPVIQWNRTLLTLLRTPGVNPASIHPTRSLALMHTAIYDAVNSIDQSHQAYKILVPVSGVASQEAAADAAGRTVLLSLYPGAGSTIGAAYQQSLSSIPDGPDKDEGIRIGEAAANQLLTIRANDGAANPTVPITLGTGPGAYQSTPPNFPAAAFTGWSQVTPFALTNASQFRPAPPPDLTSQIYTNDFNEIKSLGIPRSPAALIDQQLTGWFWNGAIQDYWNEIAQDAALAQHLTTAQTARLFALLNISLSDTVIAFYDAKYTYKFWRPVTAIRNADTAGNPATLPDPAWLPETKNTAADPSYPGAHAAASSAAAAVLASVLGSDQFNFQVTSEVFAGVERSFSTFSSAAQEATLSRIFAGQHFRFDLTAGQQLGSEVAGFVLNNFLSPR